MLIRIKMRLVILLFMLACFGSHAADTLKCPAYYDSSLALNVYEFTDVEPSFPGGEAEMLKFIRQNLVYPEIPDTIPPQSRTYVDFVVSAEGKLLNVTAFCPENVSMSPFDLEAVRIIKLMPDWIPGSCNGIPVAVKYRLPIEVYLK